MKYRNILLFLIVFQAALAFGNGKLCAPNSLLQVTDSIKKKAILSNVAPILSASGNQTYCPGTAINIVTNMSFVDPDDTGVDNVYIQISSGYSLGQDQLTLTGNHPTITSNWNATSGKLTLGGTSGQPTYTELELAIEDVKFSNISLNPSGTRTFSISISQANYLPSNGHYYEYIPNLGITWSNAKIAAQTNTYFGIQGYLATITAADEAQISGEQSSGAGWIGGSDELQEGVWKWMTGPEAGTNMVFTFWNNGEPNNLGDEDYAHVTAPGVGITGSWNDLSNTGDVSGNYQPKGYIVEYGGMPGDPIIHISTSSTLTIPTIINSISAANCDPGIVQLQATGNSGTVNWYASSTGGTPIGTGTTFTTPFLSTTTTFYVDCFPLSCTTGTRTPVVATINPIPVVSVTSPSPVCGNNSTTIVATTTAGSISWFPLLNSTVPIATGSNFTTPILTQTTTYFVEGNNNGCKSIRIPVTISVYLIPIVTNETKISCQNSSIILDAGLNNVTYLWSTSATTKTITVTNPGIYTVTVTSLPPQNCSAVKTITVIQHTTPQISEVNVIENLVTINCTGIGDFEYSLDGMQFQDSNVFSVIEGGLYTAFVREKFQCGEDNKPFIVISIPKFFTPNNDGYNDNWFIKGLSYYPNAEVKIFDRYQKLITVLNATQNFWDGTLNGKQLLGDDYWYVYKINAESTEVKGHFSLKR